ncbi:hypothetical protein GGS26DRAFT_274255 [Hypomontagnella submonticulosa]|nr:hypothetical protein GGS26DRAFT_274255 [Hypomontagnella submonticulosa]
MSTNGISPNGRSPGRDTITDEAEKEPSNLHKRKASSRSIGEDNSSQSPKRTRLNYDDVKEDSAAKASLTPKEHRKDRHENALQEERKRGKRLFGGLLSTLSQTTSSSQQKRRQEIERRQQAKVHQQRAEDDKYREERLDKLRAVRNVEQIKFEEHVMRTRHSNMLATAHYLETKSSPKIYYLPWDRTNDQEDTIQDQIREVEDIIDREVLDFKQRKEQELKMLGVAAEPPTPEKETVGSKPDNEHIADLPQHNRTNRPPSHAGKVGHEKEPDRADDVMIEEVEDTVIY